MKTGNQVYYNPTFYLKLTEQVIQYKLTLEDVKEILLYKYNYWFKEYYLRVQNIFENKNIERAIIIQNSYTQRMIDYIDAVDRRIRNTDELIKTFYADVQDYKEQIIGRQIELKNPVVNLWGDDFSFEARSAATFKFRDRLRLTFQEIDRDVYLRYADDVNTYNAYMNEFVNSLDKENELYKKYEKLGQMTEFSIILTIIENI